VKPEIFDAIHEQERTYWWFVSRRHLILDFFRRAQLQRLEANPSLKILDLGCGTGAMIEDFACVPSVVAFGMDLSPVALRFCRARGQRRVICADGTRLPFQAEAFHCVVAMDVIEHIEDDQTALQELWRVCAPNGIVLITVPALRWLWTTRDERLAHKRRYHRAMLIARAEQAGFRVTKCSYYCASVFIAFAGVVILDRLLGRKPDFKQDVPEIPHWLNTVLLRTLLIEQWLMRWIDYPSGVSLFCVLRKDARLK
jgi:SAM-dependent methyltransferase